jgi:tetratricopeptide (TPR) repeat protein
LEILGLVTPNPLASYYKGYFSSLQGNSEKAADYFKEAATAPVDNVFPFRVETISVFRRALELNPEDGRSHYYLGLVFARLADVDSARMHWEIATQLDPDNPRAWRNLGLAYSIKDSDLRKARGCYEKAFELASQDSRILLELDNVKKAGGETPVQRLAFLRDHQPVVETRDALLATMINLLNQQGEYSDAVSFLESNHFNSWEGGYSIHNAYMEANIGLARSATDPEDALAYYRKACEYPENLEVAPREPNLRGFLYYPMAKLHQDLGEREEAERLFKITAGEVSEYATLADFYRALALRDLGKLKDAEAALLRLEQEAQALIAGNSEHYRRGDNLGTALGHYYLSKVFEVRGEIEEASENLKTAGSLYPGVERQAVMTAQRVFARAHQ